MPNETKTLLSELQTAHERIEALEKQVAAVQLEKAVHSDRAAVLQRKITVQKCMSSPAGMTKDAAMEAYKKLTDARAKADFRKQHWQMLGLPRPD